MMSSLEGLQDESDLHDALQRDETRALEKKYDRHCRRVPSRADLHALLDACLDLAEVYRNAAPDPQPGHQRRTLSVGRRYGKKLVECALSWTEEDRPAGASSRCWQGELSEAEATEWRREVGLRLRRSPHVLPAEFLRPLLKALQHLDDGSGHVPSHLAAVRAPGQGLNPRLARRYEEVLCGWIAYQTGAGRTADAAKADVAAAAGVTQKAVEAWRAAWIKRDGKASVEAALAEARDNGRDQAGRPAFWSRIDAYAFAWRFNKTPTKARDRRT